MLKMRVRLVSFVTYFLTFVMFLFLTKPSFSQEGTGGLFNFFNGKDLDYWNEGNQVKDPLSLTTQKSDEKQAEKQRESQDKNTIKTRNEVRIGTQTEKKNQDQNLSSIPNSDHNPKDVGFSGSSLVRSSDSKTFSWNRYQDPMNPEFWDDGGDWIPPRPFREAAAKPTKENVDAYLAWLMKKTEVTNKLQDAIGLRAQYLLKSLESIAPKISSLESRVSNIPWARLQVAYFYQSSCPICIDSIPILEDLQKRGVQFHFVQLDFETKAPLFSNSLPYDSQMQKEFNITATPTWIFKLGQNSIMKQGRLNLKEIVKMLEDLDPSLTVKSNIKK